MAGIGIGFDLTSMGYGGSTTYVAELLGNLAPLGFENPVDLYLGSGDFAFLGGLPAGIRSHRLTTGGGGYYSRAWVQRWVIPKLLSRMDNGVLFCALGASGAALSPRKRKHRLVSVSHNMLPFDNDLRGFYPAFSRNAMRLKLLRRALIETFRNTDRHIFLSEYSRDRLLKLLPILKDRCQVIPNGIPHRFLEADVPDLKRRAQLSGTGGRYCLYLSTIEPYKNQLAVVRGYAGARELGFDVPLVLAGPLASPYAEAVAGEVSQLGLSEHVRLIGPVPYGDVPDLVKGAEVLLFASECETCPYILLEYLTAGKPIICSNTGPMPEFGGDACAYVEPASPGQWKDAFMTLRRDGGLREELGGRALERVKLYTMERCVRDTMDVLCRWGEN